MFNREGLNSLSFNGESAGETPREVNEARGEKALSEDAEQRKREIIDRIAELNEQYRILTGNDLPNQYQASEAPAEAPAVETPVEEPVAAEAPAEEPTVEVPVETPTEDEIPEESNAEGILRPEDLAVYHSELSEQAFENAFEQPGVVPETESTPEDLEAEKAAVVAAQKNNPAVKKVLVGTGIVATAALIGFLGIATFIGHKEKHRLEPRMSGPAIETTVDQVVDDTEKEKDWKELTGVDEFDKTVDGTFDQSGDLGMNKTENKSETNPLGKFSNNSMAAPETLMNEYFGESVATATTEQKALGVQMSTYKQAESAAAILTQVKAEGFKDMSYLRAVEKIKGASEEDRAKYQDMLKEIFDNSEVGETSVGEIRDALRVAGQDETLADWHYYMRRDTGEAELRNISTGGETKVLSFKYTEKTGIETTFYFLERCYNGFQVRKVVNTTTNETTYEITVYEDDDDLDKKDPEAEKKNMGNEYTDPRGLDENVTPPTTKEQDQEGFKDIEEQKRQDEEKKQQDEAERQRQAEEERKAAESENERIAQEKLAEEQRKAAEEAERRAAEQAAEEQRKAAEEESRRAAEEAARQQAQDEANRRAEEERSNADSMSTNDESRDANDWANGAFDL